MNPWLHIILSGVLLTAAGVWQGYGWYLKSKGVKEVASMEKDNRLHFKDSEFNVEAKNVDEATGMEVNQPATFFNTELNFKAENVKKAVGFSTNQGMGIAVGICPVHNKQVPIVTTGPLPEMFECPLCGQTHPLKSN